MEEKGTTLIIGKEATLELLAMMEVNLKRYKRYYAEYSEEGNQNLMDYYKGHAEHLEDIIEQIYTQHPCYRPKADEDKEGEE